MRQVLLSAACEVLLALVALCGTTAGVVLALHGCGSGRSEHTEVTVPVVARAQPQLASSDDGSERTSRGRDNLESWSFSFKSTHCNGYLYSVLALTSTVVNFLF